MAPQEVDNGRRPSRVAIVKTATKDMVCALRDKADDKDTRLLMTLAQFAVLKQTLLPSIITRTAKVLETEMFRDQATLVEVLDNMDDMVFRELIKRKYEPLKQVTQDGVLRSGIDWLNTGKPTGMFLILRRADDKEVRSYMHKAILLLVESHVRVGDIAPSLLDRVLQALVEGITDVALQSFQQIPKFGTGGMLSVGLKASRS